MQVDLSAIKIAPSSTSPPAIRNWMLGQLFDATVIGRDSGNSIRLRLAGTTVRASTTLPLQPGANLKLKVAQLKPVVTLTIASQLMSPEKNQIRAAINRALPMQRTFGALLEHLNVIDKPPASAPTPKTTPNSLPPVVTRAVHNVLQAIPTLSELRDGNRLPDVIRRLGVFSEIGAQQVLTNDHAQLPEHDLKWQLLRLRGTIHKTLQHSAPTSISQKPTSTLPPVTIKPQLPAVVSAGASNEVGQRDEASVEPVRLQKLAQLVDGTIAKIETNQLKAISALLDGDYQIALDLPIAFDDGHKVVQLKISREDNQQHAEQSSTTTIVLHVPIDESATLQAVVTLVAEAVSVRLWSSDDELRESIFTQRESLVERLRLSGLEKVSVTVAAIKPFDEWGNKFDQLVDVTA